MANKLRKLLLFIEQSYTPLDIYNAHELAGFSRGLLVFIRDLVWSRIKIMSYLR